MLWAAVLFQSWPRATLRMAGKLAVLYSCILAVTSTAWFGVSSLWASVSFQSWPRSALRMAGKLAVGITLSFSEVHRKSQS